jgi:DNA-binding SARP family transcriptional activator
VATPSVVGIQDAIARLEYGCKLAAAGPVVQWVMRIGVLGPLRVEVAGHPVELGGPRPRRLLAVLVAHAGEAVSTDTLVDAVWGTDPPPTAIKTLQSYVTRLRSALDPRRSDRQVPDTIQTAPGGYRLAVAADAVDAAVFVARVREARRAVDRGDIAAGDRLLTEAFALWRGPPYGEFSHLDFGAAEARRLEEVRLTGLETRLDIGLMAGREGEVVAEAEALCATYPLRERFWAQLITALYRGGRQADALAALRRLRTVLADEVGADPGPALRLLETQVLRHDPALDRMPSAAPEVVADRSPPLDPSGTEVAIERRVVSVLVAALGPADEDVADPERAELVRRSFRETCTAAVTATGGIVLEQADGDVVAAFGILVAYDDHVERALDAALTVLDRAGAVRAGVATGEVLRRGGPRAPTASGEPVGLATALRYAAGPGEVLVAERAVTAARQRFELSPVAERVTGGSRPLRCAVLGTVRTEAGRRPLAGLPRAFVGRGDELDALAAARVRVGEQGRPHVVHVYGEPGIGKTTLVERFVGRLPPGSVVHTGRCLPYGHGITYGPLADVLRSCLGPAGLAGREILGLTFGAEVPGDLDPQDARERLGAAWVALVEELVSAGPASFVLEDLHWAQQPLLDLVAELVAEVTGPLLVIVTARPQFAEAHPTELAPRRREHAIWLERLTDEQSTTMVKELLGEPPGEALLRHVLRPAEGNPFFIEEMLASLVDRGLLVRSAAGWRLTGNDPLAVPDSVRTALATRIDCLGPDARATLQAAAVAGRDFAAASVARLLHPARPDLGELVDRDFVRRQRASAPTYTFKHALTRQVAYDLLPVARRARLHAAYADLLAEGERLDENAPLLAHHYAEAVRPDVADLAWADEPAAHARLRELAVTWLHRAGELAHRQFAVDEAVGLFRRALDLEPPAITRAVLWRAIADAHMVRLDYGAFQDAMHRSIEVCDDPYQQAEAYRSMAGCVIAESLVASALPADDVVDGWLDKALALARPGTEAHTGALVARAFWSHEHRAELAPAALAAAERGDNQFNLINAYAMQSVLTGRQRRYSESLDWSMRIVSLVTRSDDPYVIDNCFAQPIGGFMELGRFDEAREYAARNEAVAAKQGRTRRVHAAALWIEVEALAREWARVRDFEERIRDGVRASAYPMVSWVRALLLCAVARTALGEHEEAASLERLAAELARGHDDRMLGPQIQLALARHDLDRVAELMRRAPSELRHVACSWPTQFEVIRIDALAALGDVDGVTAEAEPLIGTAAFLDAVAKRALGVVRSDPDLLREADAAFLRMGLPGYLTATIE